MSVRKEAQLAVACEGFEAGAVTGRRLHSSECPMLTLRVSDQSSWIILHFSNATTYDSDDLAHLASLFVDLDVERQDIECGFR